MSPPRTRCACSGWEVTTIKGRVGVWKLVRAARPGDAARLLAEWGVLFVGGALLSPATELGAAATYALAATLVGVVGRIALREWFGRLRAGIARWLDALVAVLEVGLLVLLFAVPLDAGTLLWFLASLGLAGVFSWLAYVIGALTADGATAATGVGGFVLGFGGWAWAAALVAFFVTSSGLGFWMKDRKAVVAENFAKTGRRDALQVLANGGVAALLAALAFTRPDDAGVFAAGFLGALAAAAADTWGTEVGVLSARKPVLLTAIPWRQVEAGTSGAVSAAGSAAGAAAAFLIGIVGAFGFWVEGLAVGNVGLTGFNVALGIAAFVGGLVGAFGDSLLGGTVQARYWCRECGKQTERLVHRCGEKTVLAGGLAWFDNDMVNLVATIIGAVVAAAVYGGILVTV